MAEAKRTGGDLTDAQAEELVEQTLASGRSSLNEAEFVRVRDYLSANPDDGPALFAAKGTDVIDDPVAAGRYVDLCLNSFGGDMLVVLADGSRVPIVDVAVGDSVAAFDTATGDVVSGPVTGVLSHTDVLVDVVLSDGSTLSMTGDHSVYDVLSGSWRPVSEFGADGALLGLSGGTLTVTGFDEASGADATAWDLSVGGAHNFFVAADLSAEPVLVHNASDFCPLPISLAQFKTLADITDPVEAAAYADVLDSFGRIAQLNDLGPEVYEASLRVLVDFAGTNRQLATDLVTTRPLWVKAASVNGDGPLADVLDAAARTPSLRAVAPDRMLQMVRRSDLDDVLAALPSVNRLSNPQPELVSHILGRPDAVDILRAMDETPIDGAAPVLAGKLNEFDFGNPSWVDVYLDAWMDVRSRGSSVFGPDSTSVSGLLASLPPSPDVSSVWGVRLGSPDPTIGVAAPIRGLILEEHDFIRSGGRQLTELNTYNRRFYPIADDFDEATGELIQYKTVDFLNFIQNSNAADRWSESMEAAINNMAAAKNVTGIPEQPGFPPVRQITADEVVTTRLELVISPSLSTEAGVNAVQVAALQRVTDYAQSNLDEVVLRWAN